MSNQVELSFIVRELGNANSEVMKLMQASRRLAAEAKQSSTEAKRLNDQQIRDLKTVVDNIERFDRAERKSGTDFVRSMDAKARAVTSLAQAMQRLQQGGLGGELGRDLSRAAPHFGAGLPVVIPAGGNGAGAGAGAVTAAGGWGGGAAGAAGLGALRGMIGLPMVGGASLAAVGGLIGPEFSNQIQGFNEASRTWRENMKVLSGMGTNPANAVAVGRDVLNKSAGWAMTNEEVANAMFAVSSGASQYSPEIQKRITEEAVAFSKGKGADIQQSVEMFTSFLNAYGELTKDVGKASDLLAKASDIGKWRPQDMAAYFGNVAPVASAFNFTPEEMLAFLVGASKVTGKPEKTFTSAIAFMNKLPEAVSKGLIKPDMYGRLSLESAVGQLNTSMIPFFGTETSALVGGMSKNPAVFTEALREFRDLPKNNAAQSLQGVLQNDRVQRHAELMKAIEEIKKADTMMGMADNAEWIQSFELFKANWEKPFAGGFKLPGWMASGLSYLNLGGEALFGSGYSDKLREEAARAMMKGNADQTQRILSAEMGRQRQSAGLLGTGDDFLNLSQEEVAASLPTWARKEYLGIIGKPKQEWTHEDFVRLPKFVEMGKKRHAQMVAQGNRLEEARRLNQEANAKAQAKYVAGLKPDEEITAMMGAAGIMSTGEIIDAAARQGELNYEGMQNIEATKFTEREKRLQGEAWDYYGKLKKRGEGISMQAAYMRGMASRLAPSQRRGAIARINAMEKQEWGDLQDAWKYAEDNTEWGFMKRAQEMAHQRQIGAQLQRQSLFYEYGAKTEDELVRKMIERQTDPNSIENRVKAGVEAMQKGVININAATINVTRANMNNAVTGAAQRNDEQSKQPGM